MAKRPDRKEKYRKLQVELDSEGDSEYSYSYSYESDAKMKAAEQEAADRKSAEQHARQKALKFGWNNLKVNVTFDEHKAVVVQSRQRKSKCDHAEIYIGNIPVDVDLLSFFKFIDKLAEGNCSQIRYRIIDGHRFFAHATLSGKSKKLGEFAAETASKIHGQYVMGISKNDSRKLKSYVAADSGPAVKIQAVVLG